MVKSSSAKQIMCLAFLGFFAGIGCRPPAAPKDLKVQEVTSVLRNIHSTNKQFVLRGTVVESKFVFKKISIDGKELNEFELEDNGAKATLYYRPDEIQKPANGATVSVTCRVFAITHGDAGGGRVLIVQKIEH